MMDKPLDTPVKVTPHDQPRPSYRACQVRWMLRRDLPCVQRIEAEAFEFPWTPDDWINHLTQRNVIGMVAEANDESIVGYMVYELHKHYLRLLNLAVDADLRRNGVGAQLIAKLKGKLLHIPRRRLIAAVRETNVAAQVFFRAQGLRCVEVVRRECTVCAEDYYLFRFDSDVDSGG